MLQAKSAESRSAGQPVKKRAGKKTSAGRALLRSLRNGSLARRRSVKRTGGSQAGALPRWADLVKQPGGSVQVKEQRERIRLSAMSTGRFALLLLIVVSSCTLYVGHVYATQDLFIEVERMRRQNLRLHLKQNRLTGEFDRATGPAAVYRRAQELGLEEGFVYGPTIKME